MPGKVPRKLTQEMLIYTSLLPRINKAFTAIPWRPKKADLPPRKKQEILVHLISDAVMKKLNTQYRSKATATDVLSFSYVEGNTPRFPHEPVGEVYVSFDTAVRQSKVSDTTLAEELSLLTVHGALHVMGYDHEKSAAELKKMRQAEKDILKKARVQVAGLTDR